MAPDVSTEGGIFEPFGRYYTLNFFVCPSLICAHPLVMVSKAEKAARLQLISTLNVFTIDCCRQFLRGLPRVKASCTVELAAPFEISPA